EPLVVQSWLASLVYGLVDRVAGFGGLRLLMAATAAVLAYAAWRLTEKAPSLTVRVVVMIPTLYVGLRTWTERPLLIALVFFAMTLLVSDGVGRTRWLVVVGALWVNVHGSWPLGLVLLATRWAGARLDGHHDSRSAEAVRRLGAGMLVGGIVNPYGPRMLLFPLGLLGRRDSLSRVAEWRSPDFQVGWAQAFLVLVLLAIVAAARGCRWRSLMPMLVFVAAALMSRRNIPVAVLVLLPVAATGLPRLLTLDGARTSPAVRTAIGAMAMLLLVVPLAAMRGPHTDLARYPVAAVGAMDAAGLSPASVHVVHQDFVGNYLDLRYRRPVAWIDDRFELHPTSLVDDYVILLEAGSGWREVLDRWDADALLWPTEAALTELVTEVAGWRIVHQADGWTVACRPGRGSC
ncbi:MAG: hypothetical protein ACE5GB_14180, partial [Acidimicrobiales bacterium]